MRATILTSLGLTQLERQGLLPLAAGRRRSLVTLAANGPVRGSWWQHPEGRTIYLAARELAAHEDILLVPLLGRQLTFVHRRLWPAFFALVEKDAAWQTKGLSKAASALLQQLRGCRELAASGPAARELQMRLLAHGEEVHGKRGSHGKVLRTWKRWRRMHGQLASRLSEARARAWFDEARMLCAAPLTPAALPWDAPRRKTRGRSRRAVGKRAATSRTGR